MTVEEAMSPNIYVECDDISETAEEARLTLTAEVKRLQAVLRDNGEAAIKKLGKYAGKLVRVEALYDAFVAGPGNPEGEGPSSGDVERFVEALGAALRAEP